MCHSPKLSARAGVINPVQTKVGGLSLALKVLPRFLFDTAARSPKHPRVPSTPTPASTQQAPATGLRVTWFGHSSTFS